MFLVDNSEARKNYEAVSQNIARIITKYGGEIRRSERWAERRLAYPVRRRDRGTYVLVYFSASPESITEIRRDCAIDEVILRNMILRVNAVPEKEPESEAAPEPAAEAEPTEGAEPAEKAEPVEEALPAVEEAGQQPEEKVEAGSEAGMPAETGEPAESTEAQPEGETADVEEDTAAGAPAE